MTNLSLLSHMLLVFGSISTAAGSHLHVSCVSVSCQSSVMNEQETVVYFSVGTPVHFNVTSHFLQWTKSLSWP